MGKEGDAVSAQALAFEPVGCSELVRPFAFGPPAPGARLRVPAVSRVPLADRQPRFIQAAAPAFTQLRAAMSEVASHPWWRFEQACRPFLLAAKTLRSYEDRMEIPALRPGHVMNLLDWPLTAKEHPASLAMLDALGGLQTRVQALRQAALANGRWWPAPQSIELMVLFDTWVGLRMRFPPGYQPPWANWVMVWHPMLPPQFAPPMPLPSSELVRRVVAMPRRPPVPVSVQLISVPRAPAPVEPPADLPPLPGCVWLLQTHVAGMAYHQAEQAMDSLQAGGLLHLRREPGNVHDALAIEVLTESGLKLGYVPRNRNPVLARLMDAGQLLQAQVLSVGSFPSHPQPWQTLLPEVRFRIDWRPAEPSAVNRGA